MAPRILIHTQHLLGVGHLMRSAALAKALADDDLDVMLISGGMPHKGLDIGRASFVQLPALRTQKTDYATLVDSVGRPIDDQFRAHRRDMLLAMVQGFNPHVVITEHFPFGRGKLRFEMGPLLAECTSRKPRPLLLASVRDIIEPPESSAKEARFLNNANAYYDGILVHGDPEFAAFDRSFPAINKLEPPLHYTGYVGATPSAATGPRSGILVSCGNGRTGHQLVEAAIDAHRLDTLDHDWEIRLGAAFGGSQDLDARVQGHKRLTLTNARSNFAADLAKSTLSVSQAGYNTVVDIAATQTNAILIPYNGHNEREQGLRATALAEHGHAVVLEEESLSPETLLAVMKQALAIQSPPNKARPFRLDGAQQTVKVIKQAIFASGLAL